MFLWIPCCRIKDGKCKFVWFYGRSYKRDVTLLKLPTIPTKHLIRWLLTNIQPNIGSKSFVNETMNVRRVRLRLSEIDVPWLRIISEAVTRKRSGNVLKLNINPISNGGKVASTWHNVLQGSWMHLCYRAELTLVFVWSFFFFFFFF